MTLKVKHSYAEQNIIYVDESIEVWQKIIMVYSHIGTPLMGWVS